MGVLRIGTSSWADPGFVEEWYPPGLPARDRLAWYAERFDAVEVNSTFYAVPGAVTVARWAEVTPEHFTFDVKVHRLLSRHSAGLDALPKDLRPNVRTTSRGRVVLDERSRRSGWRSSCHRSWTKRLDEVLRWFGEHDVAWVGVNAPPSERHFTMMPPVDAVTRPDLAYLRLHGRNTEGYVRGRSVAERFAYRDDDDELRGILARASALAGRAAEVRVVFNNNGAATRRSPRSGCASWRARRPALSARLPPDGPRAPSSAGVVRRRRACPVRGPR